MSGKGSKSPAVMRRKTARVFGVVAFAGANLIRIDVAI